MRIVVALLLALSLPAHARHSARPRHAVLERCLARAGVTPPLKVVVSLTVSRRGKVTQARLTEGSLPQDGNACLLGEMRRLRFPKRHPRALSMPLVFVANR